MSKLIHIEGIGSDEVELLEATGWTDPHALAKANPELLVKEITAANEMLRIVERTPERQTVEHWISAAARLLALAVENDSHPSSREGGEDAPATMQGGENVSIGESPAAPPVEAVDGGEAALQALIGPVNFEAEPDVIEMLSVAPFALPIPARTLAEKGIAPSEIPVAPLLNRALGDLDVRVSVERPRRQALPTAPGHGPRAAAVAGRRVADPGVSFGRRGFDSSKIRTIEEAQNDPAPVRAPLPQAGPEDERLTLLRTARPETNAGRSPGSPFYIRGVLHDRPLMVWFGGLFAVLIQLCTPLALVAAPLLILSAHGPDKFSWVPSWLIVFPVALPAVAFFYVVISARAKCRVCAQRLYVRKQCLKHRKAHHMPLLGNIGALALHVMVYKWFRCTLCGTSIRIKE